MKLTSSRSLILAATLVMGTGLTTFALPTRAEDPGTNAMAPVEAGKISAEQLKTRFEKKETFVILDVRGGDYDSSTQKIKGAVRIPVADFSARMKDLPKDTLIVTYCSCGSDGGSMSAAKALRDNGYTNVLALKGGWPAWNQAGGPVETK